MYNKTKNEITFPHLIAGNEIGGKTFTIGSNFAGVKPIGAFGLTTNTFYGGRCERMYLIKEYGFYACIDRQQKNVIGFYIHDPKELTQLGMNLIEEFYVGKKVIFMLESERPVDAIDWAERERLKAEASAEGFNEGVTAHSSNAELESLIKARRSGRADKPMGVTVSPLLTVETEEPVVRKKNTAVK